MHICNVQCILGIALTCTNTVGVGTIQNTFVWTLHNNAILNSRTKQYYSGYIGISDVRNSSIDLMTEIEYVGIDCRDHRLMCIKLMSPLHYLR